MVAMIIAHNLDDVEVERHKTFVSKHREICKIGGMIDGLFTYRLTPTTIGTFIWIQCTKCDEEVDLTNVDVM